MPLRPAVLVIAGSDSSGGAGVVRDVAVLESSGVDALCAITAVTAQSDACTGVVHPLPAQIVREQIRMACASRPIQAIKIGMLGTRAIVEAVVDCLPERDAVPIVLDPVLAATSGGTLLDEAGRRALCERLLPRVTLLTPNIPEAAALLQEAAANAASALLDQARRLLRLGPRAVLLKGGHADSAEAIDHLVCEQGSLALSAPRFAVTRRGTGCTLSSAIAAALAHGASLHEACRSAKQRIVDELAAKEKKAGGGPGRAG